MGLLDLIFPKNCLECKATGSYVCERCISKVRFPKPICPKCGKPSIDGFTHIKCKTKYGLDGLVSIWNYEGVIQKAIIALKYKYSTEVGRELSKICINTLKSQITNYLLPTTSILVPIPMHWYRENSRGFNQSLKLGRSVARAIEWKFAPELLVRKRLTTPQAKLKGKERSDNIKGVFSLSPNIVISQYLNIVLFDDVYTTGSTLKEAAKVLKRKGAKSVWGLTVTR